MDVRRGWLVGLTAAVLLAVAGAACGGSDSDGTGPEAATATPTEAVAPEAAALRTLLARAEGRPFQATYDATLTGESTATGQVVLAQQDGRAVTRLTLDTREGIPFSQVVIIAAGEKTTACFGDTGRGTCLKAGGDPAKAFPNPLDLDGMLERITGDKDVKRLPDETVAGIPSECYETGSGGEHGVACFAAASGVPTRLDAMSDGARATLRVREIRDSVEANVFDTPKDYVTLGR